MDRKTLKDRVKELGNSLPLMENREKGSIDNLIGKEVTIIDYGFMKDEHDDEYVAFITKEDNSNFYFGGSVLTQDMKELDAEGYSDEIKSFGLPIKLEKKMSKNKREYTSVTYL